MSFNQISGICVVQGRDQGEEHSALSAISDHTLSERHHVSTHLTLSQTAAFRCCYIFCISGAKWQEMEDGELGVGGVEAGRKGKKGGKANKVLHVAEGQRRYGREKPWKGEGKVD